MSNSSQKATLRPKVSETEGRAPALWLGYAPTGGRVSLRHVEMRQRLLVTGRRADEMAALLAYAGREAGLRTIVLDLDGNISDRVSGYCESYDYTCYLYDAFLLEEDDATRHSQLLAAAYTAALDLSSEEEAIMMAALHKLARGDIMASPAVLFEAIGTVEGFRGFYVEKLQGRIGAVKYLESAENGSLRSLMSLGSSLISFRSASYPQAMEIAAAAFVAKLLSVMQSAKTVPDLVIISGAHRIFRALPKVDHSNRLLTELLESRTTFVLASDERQFLSQQVQDAFPFKILSSDAWNEGVRERWKGNAREPVLPNSYVMADGHFGHQRTLIARTFEPRRAELRKGPPVVEANRTHDDGLTLIVLDDIKRYGASTRASLIEFLSGEYGAERVQHELDRLHSQGHITLQEKEVRPGGPPMLVYALTPSGETLLEALAQ
ncbi:MAG: hypothetical protein OK441_00875 [Thaumarchaeota archaeon]|nr:hypothetical protein [Nitrososphaerota archaeon]